MTEHDATEVAYKRGYTQAVRDVFEKIDDFLSMDISHSYLSGSFILPQDKYAKIKEKFLEDAVGYFPKSSKEIAEDVLHPELKLPITEYKNLEDFKEKNCHMCGSQLCDGPYDEFADGCNYLKVAVFEDGSKPI